MSTRLPGTVLKTYSKTILYNPTMPYSSQVNPYAETYMQDYLQAHGKYLSNMGGTQCHISI